MREVVMARPVMFVVLGVSIAAQVVILLTGNKKGEVNPEYFSAAATVIPLLLISVLAALGRFRPIFRRISARLEEHQVKASGEIERIRDRLDNLSHEATTDAEHAEINSVRREVDELRRDRESDAKRIKWRLRWLRGAPDLLLVSAALAAAYGEIVALSALAHDDPSSRAYNATLGIMASLVALIIIGALIDED